MKKFLYGIFIGLSSLLCDQFTNSTMSFYGNWKQYSQWGVWTRVNKPPIQWLKANPTYAYVPLVIQGYNTTPEESAILQKQPSGGLKPDMFRDYPDMVGLDPTSSGYVSFEPVSTPPFNQIQLNCNSTSSPQYGIPPGKCASYRMQIDPYALINNLTKYLQVEAFAIVPCEPCGSTTEYWLANLFNNSDMSWMKDPATKAMYGETTQFGFIMKTPAIENWSGDPCERGSYPSFDGGTTQVGWYKEDWTMQANQFMRFGAALMTPQREGGQLVENQNYLTIQKVNQVANAIFVNLSYTDLFGNNMFELYFSNDGTVMQGINSSSENQW